MNPLVESWELATGLFRDGFIALIAAGIFLPPLGALLSLRRMPFVTIAVPAVAGAGVAFAFWVWPLIATVDFASGSLAPPPISVQNFGALLALTLGIWWLAGRSDRRTPMETHSAILFVAALALSEIFAVESRYEEIADQWLHHGRILSVLPEGRNRVLAATFGAALFWWVFRRQLWLTALDRDFGRLRGLRAGHWLFITLALVGFTCAFTVPELGPQTILALLLIPATLLRPVATTLVQHACWSSVVGLVSVFFAFTVAVDRNWPVTPALTVGLIGLSWLLRWGLRSRRSVRS